MNPIDDLLAISRYYGKDNRFVIAGGGNTSYKDEKTIWVKASGASLATLSEDGLAILDRSRLTVLSERTYSEDPAEREEQVKQDLAAATLTKGKRPSVETSMHNAINYAYVVHLHPTLVNGLMCSNEAASTLKRLFGEKALYISYTDPGYVLFKKVEQAIRDFRSKWQEEPHVIWLQNHGLFVAADTIDEIKQLYSSIFEVLEKAVLNPLPVGEISLSSLVEEVLPAIRMMLSAQGLKTLRVRSNALTRHFSEDSEQQALIARPFTPDGIVYGKSSYLFLNDDTPEALLQDAAQAIPTFEKQYGYLPKVLLIKGIGLVAAGDNAAQCAIILDVFEDAMKVAWYAESFGGPHPMTEEQIHFIDTWEVENYRRQVAVVASTGRAENKTIVVTGAAQGFGEGIARNLILQGANIVVADLNESLGQETVNRFNSLVNSNQAYFVKTDVSQLSSVERLMHETVARFGAIDCFISNAGVLRAGGLEE